MDNEPLSFGTPTRSSRWALRLCIAGVGAFAAYCILVFAVHVWHNPLWLIAIYEQHFLATVGAPLAMVAALMIVTLFRYQAGPIEFEILTIKFRGAAGPVVMWILAFLSMILAIKVLW